MKPVNREEYPNDTRSVVPDERNCVVVPDLDAGALLGYVKRLCRPSFLHPNFEGLDVWRGLDGQPIIGRGQTFESLVWKPDRETIATDVRAYFTDKGFQGNTGVFLAWAAQNKPEAPMRTVPAENGCWRGRSQRLYVPTSFMYGRDRQIGRDWVETEWDEFQWFVAFREILP